MIRCWGQGSTMGCMAIWVTLVGVSITGPQGQSTSWVSDDRVKRGSMLVVVMKWRVQLTMGFGAGGAMTLIHWCLVLRVGLGRTSAMLHVLRLVGVRWRQAWEVLGMRLVVGQLRRVSKVRRWRVVRCLGQDILGGLKRLPACRCLGICSTSRIWGGDLHCVRRNKLAPLQGPGGHTCTLGADTRRLVIYTARQGTMATGDMQTQRTLCGWRGPAGKHRRPHRSFWAGESLGRRGWGSRTTGRHRRSRGRRLNLWCRKARDRRGTLTRCACARRGRKQAAWCAESATYSTVCKCSCDYQQPPRQGRGAGQVTCGGLPRRGTAAIEARLAGCSRGRGSRPAHVWERCSGHLPLWGRRGWRGWLPGSLGLKPSPPPVCRGGRLSSFHCGE